MARAQPHGSAPLACGATGARVAIQMNVPMTLWSSKVVVPTAAKPEPVAQDNGKHGPLATMRSAPTVRRKRFIAGLTTMAAKPEPVMMASGRIMANAVMMTSVSMTAAKPKTVAPMIAAAKPEPVMMALGEHGENVPAKILVTTVRAKPWVVDTTVLVNRFAFVAMDNGALGPPVTTQTSAKTAV